MVKGDGITSRIPEEDVEKEIMLKETFRIRAAQEASVVGEETLNLSLEDIARKVAVPWWVMDILNKAVRYLDKRPSIRATYRALDHTYSSVEMENRWVANLCHAYYGLRLALRGRLGLRADMIDLNNPKKAFKLGDQLAEDFIWNVFQDLHSEPGFLENCDRQKLGSELASLSSRVDLTAGKLPMAAVSQYDELANVLNWMRGTGMDNIDKSLANRLRRNYMRVTRPRSWRSAITQHWRCWQTYAFTKGPWTNRRRDRFL
jgi:hypothetical protein